MVKTGTEAPQRLPKHHHLLAASKAKDILLENPEFYEQHKLLRKLLETMETCAIAFHFEWFPTVSNGFLRVSFKLQAGSQRKPMPLPIALSEAVKHSVPKGQVGVVQSMGAMNPYATMRQPRGEGTRGKSCAFVKAWM